MLRSIFLFALIGFCSALAQEKQVKGIIRDFQTQEPLSGVSVIKDKNRGVSSDNFGRFSIFVSNTDTLTFKMLGYKTLYQKIDTTNSVYQIFLKKTAEILDQVVVTGTKTQHNLINSPVQTQVITQKDIRNSGEKSLTSLLESSVSGIVFTSHAGVANISVRGLDAKYILILINGKRIAGETFNNIDFENIDVEKIEKIEIIKDASSSLYGSNAMGGVINIITKQPNQKFEIKSESSVSTLKSLRQNLSAQFQYKKLRSLTSFTYKNTSSYSLYDTQPIENHYPNNVIKYQEKNRWEVEGGTLFNFNQSLNFQISNQWKLSTDANLYHRKRHNSSINKGEVLDTYFYNYSIHSSLEGSFDNFLIQADYNYSNYQKAEFYKRLLQEENVYTNPLHELKIFSSKKLSNATTLSVGASFLKEMLHSYMFSNNNIPENQAISGFLQTENRYSKSLSSVVGVRIDKYSHQKINLSPKISVLFKPNEKWQWRTSVGKGFRTPTLKELFTDWDHLGMFRIVGNKNLKPETNTQVSSYINYHNKKISGSFGAFYNHIRNKINTLANTAGDTLFYQNTKKQTLKGVELSLKYAPFYNFNIQAEGCLTYDGGDENGKNISGIRPFDLSFKANYYINGKSFYHILSLNGKLLSSTKVYFKDSPENTYYYQYHKGYQLWNINYILQYEKGIEWSVQLNNIFNYKPPIYGFYSANTPGATLQTTLSLYLDKIFNF